jgi:ABC-type lipoprotein release transport system permease subunit
MRSSPPKHDPATSEASSLAPRGRPAAFLLLRLALADLWHERMLTACVTVALTAVLAPLLILLSLKYGLVETLRARLLSDPRNREIRPQSSQTYTVADIQALRDRTDVSFVMPLLSSFSTDVLVTTDKSPQRVEAELIPTLDGDPMLAENGTPVPSLAQCALSRSLYHRLAGTEGDLKKITLHLTRRGASGLEEASVPLEVTGAVSERASSRETLFIQFQLLQEIENYLKGLPVPRLGWGGEAQSLSPVIEDIFFTVPQEFDTIGHQNLVANTAFSTLEKMTPQEYGQYIQETIPEGHFCYHLGLSDQRSVQPATPDDILRLRNTLPPNAGNLHGNCRQVDAVSITRADGSLVRTTDMLVLPEIVSAAPKRLSPTQITAKNPFADIRPNPPKPPTGETVQKAVPVEVGPDGKTIAKTLGAPQIVLPPPPAAASTPASPGMGRPAAPVFHFDKPVIIPSRPVAPPIRKKTAPAPKSSKSEGESKESAPSGRRRTDKAPTGFIPAPPQGARYIMAKQPRPEPETLPEPAPQYPPPLPAAGKAESPMPTQKPRRVHLPASWGLHTGETVLLGLDSAGGPLSFSAIVQTHTSGENAALEQSLAGVLRAAQDTPARFDPEMNTFVAVQDLWPSFRLIASDIDHVQSLVDHFHARGINVLTKAERIRDVKELDAYTSHVFWLIAAVGLTGAVGALLASLIAAVERKRRSLGVMRLLGIRRRSLLRLPFYQSALIVTLSVGLAVAAWHWASGAISTFTQRYLEAGESLKMLPPTYLLALWGGALGVAGFASLIASIRVMSVDPSEAIRDE